MHGNPETLTTLLVQVRNVYYLFFLLLVFFFNEERETQFLPCWLFHLTQKTHGASRNSTEFASSSFKSQLASPRIKSHLTAFFFQNHQESQPIAYGHDVIRNPVSFPIRVFYYDICDCHILCARAWTPALNVCTCTCTKPNSSKPN